MSYRKTLSIAIAGNACFLLIVYCCNAQQNLTQGPQDNSYVTLQVIVLSFKEAADAYVADLQKKGYPAYISELTTQRGKVLYRVRVGRFSTDAEARRYASNFTALGQTPPVIVKSSEQSGLPGITQHAEQKLPAAAAPPTVVDDNKTAAVSSAPPPETAAPKIALHTVDNQTVAYYTVQLSAVADKTAAERHLASLTAKGFPAYIFSEKKGPGAYLYRVRVGKYETQDAAKNIALHVQSREKVPCIIVRTLDTSSVSSYEKPSAPQPDDGILEDNENQTGLSDQSRMLLETVTQTPLETAEQEQGMPPAAPEQAVSEQDQPPADTIIKIFIYRQPNGSLSLTNNYYSIPVELRKNIEYISLYPVRFLSLDSLGTHILCDIDGTAKPVAIAGVGMPSRKYSQQVAEYFTKQLNRAPLRLKYNPSASTADGTIIGILYLRDGTYINPDLIRKGVAPLCLETLPQDQHALFKKAEEHARQEHKGIWATP